MLRYLGTYHVNIIYVGPGMQGYQSRRIEFLWVQWYCNTGMVRNLWNNTLDQISFGPMADDNTFGFIDPSAVLRAVDPVVLIDNTLAITMGPLLTMACNCKGHNQQSLCNCNGDN